MLWSRKVAVPTVCQRDREGRLERAAAFDFEADFRENLGRDCNDPQFADAYLRRGDVLLNQLSPPPKDREKGWADRSQAIALGIRNARLFAARAAERGSENIDGALSDIEKALAMEPKNPAYLKQRDALLKLKRK